MRLILSPASVGLALSLLAVPVAGHAAGTNLISTNTVGDTSGWFSTTTVEWKTNNGAGVPIGTAVSKPVAGNTYTLKQGGKPAIGNNLGKPEKIKNSPKENVSRPSTPLVVPLASLAPTE